MGHRADLGGTAGSPWPGGGSTPGEWYYPLQGVGLRVYTLHPTPYTLHPTLETLHPTLYTLSPRPFTLNSTPSTPPLDWYYPLQARHETTTPYPLLGWVGWRWVYRGTSLIFDATSKTLGRSWTINVYSLVVLVLVLVLVLVFGVGVQTVALYLDGSPDGATGVPRS